MKEQFIEIFQSTIKRDGADKLLNWLIKSDFFEAPASTRYHLAKTGGLAEHSINVYHRLKCLVANEIKHNTSFSPVTAETIAVCGLLHDICKVNFYKTEMRNAKNESGQWVKVPYYVVEDQVPYGHGEKSVYIASGFMNLSREEAMAIRWHMGGFDDAVKGGSYALSIAWGKFPIGILLHIADIQATYIDEKEGVRDEKK